MKRFTIEVTRKCNLSCKWCCKGDPEPVDLSFAHIDKCFDELADVYIFELRISGGEPFCNPDACIYIIDEVIRRNLKVGTVRIFHNGTIKNEQVLAALQRLVVHFDSMQSRRLYRNLVSHFGEYDVEHVNERNRVRLIVSTMQHDNTDTIQDVISFYSGHDGIFTLGQDVNVDFNLTLEGSALKNWREFPQEYLDRARVIVRNTSFISDYGDNLIAATKCITLTAKGDIMIGASTSHVNEDNGMALFSIDDCHHDLFERLSAWCWEHPLPESAYRIYAFNGAAQWKRENGIALTTTDKAFSNEHLLQTLKNLESMMKSTHINMPLLHHAEVSDYVIAFFYLYCFDDPNLRNQVVALYKELRWEKLDGSPESKQLAYDAMRYFEEVHERRKKGLPSSTVVSATNQIGAALASMVDRWLNPPTSLDLRAAARKQVIAEREAAKWDAIRATKHMIN